jgi:hypothetical protein
VGAVDRHPPMITSSSQLGTRRPLRRRLCLTGGEACSYCGEFAQCTDHLDPFQFVGNATQLLPSCMECNDLAGARFFNSFDEKKAFIRTQIERRYRSVLAMKAWKLDALDQLGPDIRARLQVDLRHREILLRRLRTIADLSPSQAPL